jgi:hypothetical protein
MKNSNTLSRYPAIALVLMCITNAHSAEVRIACDHADKLDAMMAARYIHTPKRALFDVSFKAPTSMGYEARRSLEVRVDGYVVGYAELMPRAGNTLGASLSFDSYANSGYADNPFLLPFPSSWPGSLPPQPIGISEGSRIMIGSLGCTLR